MAKEFETEGLTLEQMAAIAYQWDGILKESRVLRLALGLLERQEREVHDANRLE
ncbi:MAG: hypothetical protein WBE76_21775 [Terracidiphilus sp.]